MSGLRIHLRSAAQRTRRALLAAVLVWGLVPLQGAAAEVEGVLFDEQASLGGTLATLRGAGLLRYRLFIKAYVAAFYTAGPEANPLGDSPRRLEIEYFWPLAADQFASATRAGMAANVSASELLELETGIQQMNELYEDIEPGDRYSLTYLDGRTELAKNGRVLGSVEGEAFGRAMFSIWLGEKPLSPSLKDTLLGGTPP